jgi:hypothetical protein
VNQYSVTCQFNLKLTPPLVQNSKKFNINSIFQGIRHYSTNNNNGSKSSTNNYAIFYENANIDRLRILTDTQGKTGVYLMDSIKF